MKILFINTCVRENSRTKRLADYFLKEFSGDEITEVQPRKEGIAGLDEEMLKVRDQALLEKNYDHPVLAYAKQFKEADMIVIAAPYWDLSFPSALKNYIERICAVGMTFDYDEHGIPYGMCSAENLVYIQTAGGMVDNDAFGYGYIKALCENFFHIEKTFCFKAEGLDLPFNDPEELLKKAEEEIDSFLPDLKQNA